MRLRDFILIGLLATLLPAAAGAAGPRIGEVKVAEGEVVIERVGREIPAEVGTDLHESDIVRTGADGAVGMTFTDNSRMSLGPSSELELEKYRLAGSRQGFDARLLKGSMTASSGEIAKSRPMAMRVLIPTGILGVRGTEFVARVNP